MKTHHTLPSLATGAPALTSPSRRPIKGQGLGDVTRRGKMTLPSPLPLAPHAPSRSDRVLVCVDSSVFMFL
ncbi:hypothetical protein E2C01_057162 [Portunus trituberculatus]|uniref:Uncharacterized protein n=1 Tax=Portunus trituberculatus TaxID=210409 RepID=A0A5B7GSP0_PORTR|nr:hypothetical protein [Portunus trituberculatus]